MPDYGEAVTWTPERPRYKVSRLLLSWFFTAVSLGFAALVLPGVDAVDTEGAILMAACVAVLNALLPPIVAALRLPYTIGLGFVLVLLLNAVVLLVASDIVESYQVDSFGWALLAALIVAVSFSTHRNAGMSSFEPSRIPAWLAPVWEERSGSHSTMLCVSAASQRAMFGAFPSRIARRRTGSASPSISR